MRSQEREVEKFIGHIAALRFDDVFNPYSDVCVAQDIPDAAGIRRRNLSLVLNAALTHGVESIWIARDLGYLGGRRTGLALTDEAHLGAHADLFGGALPLARATKGPAVAERTATIVWQVLNELQRPIFLWNVFPLHPHQAGNPFSNRCHSRFERQACRPLLIWLLETLRPKSIIAIGRDAERGLAELEVSAEKIRHPSYGGKREFVEGMHSRFGLAQGRRLL
ncbi:uracil-DNA glycosylase [Methylocystis heyeri]|uniref:Uracil-DNA glycosylase n=1 Tax=Methylocystis heyeri TaxID=391905 RepID=A0A6B8KDV3_9HYPH|nr:uracil-DNA glycosylase [Methylocystis heyeri]QGM45191.1 uracil-DNA glycosylase [Methylocystis heyeri]